MKKENGDTLVPSGQFFLPAAAIGPSVMRRAHVSRGPSRGGGSRICQNPSRSMPRNAAPTPLDAG